MKGIPTWLIVVAKFLLAGLAGVVADQSIGGPVASLVDSAKPLPEAAPSVSSLSTPDYPRLALAILSR
jgi:hypothetical protein